MNAHKYWSLGALACMAGCFCTGCKKLMQTHKYFACGSLFCMGMAIYSGSVFFKYSSSISFSFSIMLPSFPTEIHILSYDTSYRRLLHIAT